MEEAISSLTFFRFCTLHCIPVLALLTQNVSELLSSLCVRSHGQRRCRRILIFTFKFSSLNPLGQLKNLFFILIRNSEIPDTVELWLALNPVGKMFEMLFSETTASF